MKSIGKQLKEKRKEKNLTLEQVVEKTKIKKEFIRSIEKEDWDALPDYPVVTGFVKSIAKALDVKEDQVVAHLRRDYPPKDTMVNPKPDVFDSFKWSPRLTFLVGVLVTVILVVGYLLFQYISFTNPPSLEVDTPQNGAEVIESTLYVSGSTDPEATVRINNQPVLVDESGKFSAEVEIFDQTKEIIIKSTSRSGKETEVRRTIIPKLE